jgi:tetratricopeptide (TPR) repeat protein
MSDDTRKIEELKAFLTSQPTKLNAETISLALSVEEVEERDLALLNIVGFLAEKADWDRAFGVAQLIENGYERVDSLHKIASKLTSAGHLQRAIFVFEEAEKEIKTVETLWQQAELLLKIAKSLRTMGATYKANEILEKAVAVAQNGENSASRQNSLDSSSVLSEIAENISLTGKIERAVNIAQNIKNIGTRERTLKNISSYSENVGQTA